MSLSHVHAHTEYSEDLPRHAESPYGFGCILHIVSRSPLAQSLRHDGLQQIGKLHTFLCFTAGLLTASRPLLALITDNIAFSSNPAMYRVSKISHHQKFLQNSRKGNFFCFQHIPRWKKKSREARFHEHFFPPFANSMRSEGTREPATRSCRDSWDDRGFLFHEGWISSVNVSSYTCRKSPNEHL